MNMNAKAFDFGLPGEVSISMGNMIIEFVQLKLCVADDTHAKSPAISLYNEENNGAR